MAFASKPANIPQLLDFGLKQLRAGNDKQAEAVFKQVLASDKHNPDANHLLGVLALGRRDFKSAVRLISKALKYRPNSSAYLNNLGNAYKELNRNMEAISAYRKAVEAGPPRAEIHYNLGTLLAKQGQYQQALSFLHKAVELNPEFAEACNSLAVVSYRMGRHEESKQFCDNAVLLNPESPEAHNNLGNSLRALNKTEEAESAYNTALKLKPDYTEAYCNLAILFQRQNRLDLAKENIEKALSIRADYVLAHVISSALKRREGRLQEALSELEDLDVKRYGEYAPEIHQEMGKIYDQLNNSESAFRHFSSANTLRGKRDGSRGDKDVYHRRVQGVQALLEKSSLNHWRPAAMDDPHVERPIFIVGFPRSGTTLLDQILDSHPAIQVMEEQPVLKCVEDRFLEMKGGNLEGLITLTDGETRELRKEYYDSVDRFIERDRNCLLVDKFPLNLIRLHVAYALFPDAKILLALRHPLDVCLSNFMQDFATNNAMANFFTLEDTARLYDQVMSLWQKYEEVLPLVVHKIRYEDIVEDMQSEVERLLAFLGVEWDDRVLNFMEHARGRNIRTPSYEQVVQPIYKRSRFRWKRYEKQLEPCLGLLGRHMELFGY